MSNLAYLGVAVVISLVGCLVLWLRTRRPRSMEHSIREFSRELDALAPPDGGPADRSPRPRGRRAG
ncbi:MAG: hypothetical protein ABR511_14470 [Acidimicrobiales bacterium]